MADVEAAVVSAFATVFERQPVLVSPAAAAAGSP
jgi:hypothetical protein